MKQAVMYGGGNIGRGFIGATLSQAGSGVAGKEYLSRALCFQRGT